MCLRLFHRDLSLPSLPFAAPPLPIRNASLKIATPPRVTQVLNVDQSGDFDTAASSLAVWPEARHRSYKIASNPPPGAVELPRQGKCNWRWFSVTLGLFFAVHLDFLTSACPCVSLKHEVCLLSPNKSLYMLFFELFNHDSLHFSACY